MSNQGKGGGQPADDRTLLDPLDADELKALREARQRLSGGGAANVAPSQPAGDDGDGPTRAMMAIPSFDSQPAGRAKFMAEPKPMKSGSVGGGADAATLLDGAVPAGLANVSAGKGQSPAPGAQPAKPGEAKPPEGFGENTLMWMQPVKAPEPAVDPARGAAAVSGMIPTQVARETRSRKLASTALLIAATIVVVGFAVFVLKPGAEPVDVELVTNPPKASVLIDGKTYEVVTPMKAKLPPGTHKIDIQLEGYRTETLNLVVQEGQPASRRTIELFPLSKPGLMTVTVQVEPIAANITVDGRQYPARKIVRIPDLDPKAPHKIQVEAGGYAQHAQDIAPNSLAADYSITLQRAE